MAQQLKEIVDRLNAEPFNMDRRFDCVSPWLLILLSEPERTLKQELSLLAFDEKEPYELVDDVLRKASARSSLADQTPPDKPKSESLAMRIASSSSS